MYKWVKLNRTLSCLKIARKRETLSNNKECSLFYCFSPIIIYNIYSI